GNIVIVAGFQGVSLDDNITTLGRGGSDLSAVALASVLKAQACEIYTDVDGVYSADPRIVPRANKIEEISYDEMLELSSAGAGVMQSRSMEVAKREKVKLHIRSSLEKDKFNKGTIVMDNTKDFERIVVRGVTLDVDQVKMSILNVPDRPGVAASIFGALAEAQINVDMIIQTSPHEKGLNDISFTINSSRLADAQEVLDKVRKKINAGDVVSDKDVSKVSIVGVGMRSHAGVAAKMFEVLFKNSINIEMISTSEIKISCVVDSKKGKKAVKALHDEFCGKK
ncbi:MAG: aspartate kinase, partial [Elusimicrobiota bacterium]